MHVDARVVQSADSRQLMLNFFFFNLQHKQEAQALLNLVGNKRSRAHLNPISEGSKDECDEGDEEEEDDEVLMEESIMKIDSSSIQMDETNSDSE